MPASKLHTAPAYPYLQLDQHIEQAIKEDRRNGWINPYRFDESHVTRRLPNPHDEATLTRPAFIRDIEKILNVPAYNRYAGKTQVFIQQRQFGLGCVNSWGAWPRDEYRLAAKDYDFTFAIKPVK